MEFVTNVDTHDVGEAVKDIRYRLDIPSDMDLTVRYARDRQDDMPEPTPIEKVVPVGVEEPTRRTFTRMELIDIKATLTAEGEIACVEKVWEFILGEPLDAHEGSINPGMYLIPEAQWTEIAGYMVHDKRVQNPSYEGIPGWTMVNQGPSSYTPSEEDA